MATKKHITFQKNASKENNDQHVKPFCVQSEKASEEKAKADALRPLAAEELQAMLDAKPETKDYTGTVVYICDGEIYKIRVQRHDKTDWMAKRLNDPNLKELKALTKEVDEKKVRIDELKEQLAIDHPRCITKDFNIAYLSK